VGRLTDLCLVINRSGATGERLLRKAYLEIEVGNYEEASKTAQTALAMDAKLQEAELVSARAQFYLALVRAGVMEGAYGTELGNPGPQILAAYKHVSHYVDAVKGDQDAEVLCDYLDGLVMRNEDSSRMTAALRRDLSPATAEAS
jgi:hypothetical protein